MELLLKTDALSQLQARQPYNDIDVDYANAIIRWSGRWVTVETLHLFDDQYNIKEGNLRVYDCMVAEIKDDIRPGLAKCGYCGYSHIKVGESCPKCKDGVIEDVVEHKDCACGAGKPGRVPLKTSFGNAVKIGKVWRLPWCSQCLADAAHVKTTVIRDAYPPRPYPVFKPVDAVSKRHQAYDSRLRRYNGWCVTNGVGVAITPRMTLGALKIVDGMAHYGFVLRCGANRYSGVFHQSRAATKKGWSPDVADVLQAVVCDASCYQGAKNYDDFVAEFGGGRIEYTTCKKAAGFFARACTDSEVEKLGELEFQE